MRLAAFKDLTRFEQTLFALPFVLSSTFFAMASHSFSLKCLWIFPAFLSARLSGMAFNQLIDRHIDALNPRTCHRALPTKRVKVKEARIVAWGTLILFLTICMKINLLTSSLALVAAFLIFIYSYLKRIHAICHFVLGTIHFLGTIMAYTAMTGSFSFPVCFLGVAAGLSITGNDIAYAIQDYEFDRRHHLFSLPARFGIQNSLFFSAVLHFLCLGMLLGFGLMAHLCPIYFCVLPTAAIIFICFHRALQKHKSSLKTIESSFFMCNVAVSFSTLFFTLSHILWDVLL